MSPNMMASLSTKKTNNLRDGVIVEVQIQPRIPQQYGANVGLDSSGSPSAMPSSGRTTHPQLS